MQSLIDRLSPLWTISWRSRGRGKRHEVHWPRKPVEVALGLHATDRLVGRPGMQLHCIRGCLWITHDGDPKDVLISVGQRCDTRPGYRVLVHAVEASTYCVE